MYVGWGNQVLLSFTRLEEILSLITVFYCAASNYSSIVAIIENRMANFGWFKLNR